jgi:hypothetical protein
MKLKHVPLCALLLAQTLSTAVHAAEHREHGPHEHGAANLNVALDGNRLAVELISPAVNIVGFEHAPESVEDRERIQQAVATLEDGARLYVFPSDAGCLLRDADVDSELLREFDDDHHGHHDKEHHREHAGEAGDEHPKHSEFRVLHTFHCTEPTALMSMDVNLFTLFPGMRRLAVQYVTTRGQGGAALRPGRRRLSF